MRWLERPASDLYLRFEGLGNNCEFGIVQRKADVDPPGLFRNVGFLSIRQIIDAIASGLAGLFDEGMFAYTRRPGWPDYATECRVYGFTFHTGIPVDIAFGSREWEAEAARKTVQFRFLKRKLLGDLESGDKLFVYRSDLPVADHEMRSLQAAIGEHGPGWLLFVAQDPSRPGARVEMAGERLIRAWMPRLSRENPPVIDLQAWDDIARQSLALRFGDRGVPCGWRAAGTDTRLAQVAGPFGSASCVVEHRLLENAVPQRPAFHYALSDQDAGAPYLASAWVNVPAPAAVRDLGLAFHGRRSLRFAKADLHVRDRWQHLFVICGLEERGPLIPGLAVDADAGALIYSAGWEFGRLQSLVPDAYPGDQAA